MRTSILLKPDVLDSRPGVWPVIDSKESPTSTMFLSRYLIHELASIFRRRENMRNMRGDRIGEADHLGPVILRVGLGLASPHPCPSVILEFSLLPSCLTVLTDLDVEFGCGEKWSNC